MNIQDVIKEIVNDNNKMLVTESELKEYYKDRTVIKIWAITKSWKSADICLTDRSVLDAVITDYKRMGRTVVLPPKDDKDCFGLCAVRCVRFNHNCRKCIKEFYGVDQ